MAPSAPVCCSEQRPLVGISGCLAGLKVRYDGRDKRHPILHSLSQQVQLHPICPEAAIGLGIPRPPIQLVQIDAQRILVRGRDLPDLQPGPALKHLGASLGKVHANSWCGFICQSRSPSCGFGSTPVYDPHGQPVGVANGAFIESLQQTLPWLPILEDTALDDADQVAAFIKLCWDIQRNRQRQTSTARVL